MAQAFDQNEQQHEDNDSTYADFFNAVRNGKVEDVRHFLSQLGSTNNPGGERTPYREKLLKALAEKNIGAVARSLILEGGEEEIKTLETLNSICKTVAKHERLREAGLFS